MLKLVMGSKNDVSMVVGPTSADGSVFVSADEIIAEIDKTTSMFPQDYRPDTWTRKVEARVMTAADVGRFERGIEAWGASSEVFRPGEVEAIRGWGAHLKEQFDATLEVRGEVIGSEIADLAIRPATWFEENRDKLGPK